MPLTTAGRDALADLIIGGATDAFNNANAHLGAGDSTTAFAVAQTDLQAETNKVRKGMEDTYPQRSDNVLTFLSEFGAGDGNFDWREIAVFNAAADGTMLCRVVVSEGTKAAGQVWTLEHEVTVVNADE